MRWTSLNLNPAANTAAIALIRVFGSEHNERLVPACLPDRLDMSHPQTATRNLAIEKAQTELSVAEEHLREARKQWQCMSEELQPAAIQQ